jgi:anti-sigma regulatory factor (Ser/Thr protein kinase)
MVLSRSPQVMSMEVPALPTSVAQARVALDSFALGLPSAKRDDARLLLSELVTNSIRHGGMDPSRTVQLQMSEEHGSLRVEVTNRGLGFGEATLQRERAGSGWGLALVARIADRWGVVEGEGVTTVWFELTPEPRSRIG